MSEPRRPRPDDAVLGGQSLTPADAVVLGGLEGAKQRFGTGDIEVKQTSLDQTLQYGDKGFYFVAAVSEQELPDEVKSYAKRLQVLEILRVSDSKSLKGMDLRGVDLGSVALIKANLSGANLSGANLSGARVNKFTIIDEQWKAALWWDSLIWDDDDDQMKLTMIMKA